jgi:Flp pilus assembly protein TadD
MPREKAEDVAHEQVTDHRIQRRAALSRDRAAARTGDLTVVGGGVATDRELGLAYFQLAELGDQQSGHKAMSLLQQAERRLGEQADPDLHTALGFIEQLSGDLRNAMREYQAAVGATPADSAAAGDMAILRARTGDVKGAVAGLQQVSKADPADSSASMDLALIECAIGDPEAAKTALQHLLEFSPDDGKARQLLTTIASKPETCTRH